jgi:hypothetical protein
MKGKRSTPLNVLLVILLISTGALARRSAPGTGKRIDNLYLTMTILSGWTVGPSVDQKLNLTQGKYLLIINPIFTHASGVEGGRFSEIVEGMPSVDAVMRNVDQPASGAECALNQSQAPKSTQAIELGSLYTDSSKTGNGCVFPTSGPPVWFGSYSGGEGPESEYTITLSYNTADVNSLPRIGSAQLTQVLAEVVAMLKTLRLKPPIIISEVSPQSAPPGAIVTIYGSGFILGNSKPIVSFSGITEDLNAIVAEEGKSLTFQVPSSILTVSCQEGRISIGGFCLPIPAGHVDVNDCPRKSDGSSNSCGIPIPPAIYQIRITTGGVNAGPVPFTVTTAKPRAVLISLMYPISFVSAGDTITVRGKGFTMIGNSVRIGSAVVDNISSPDGKTITFRAPEPVGSGIIHGMQIFEASVSNANGESNSISFAYR